MQEVGCNHAQSVGFSTDGFATTPTMRKLHLIWVTARMHIEIYKYPAWWVPYFPIVLNFDFQFLLIFNFSYCLLLICILLFGVGVMWLKLRHGVKGKGELELDVIGYLKIMPLVKL